MMISLAYDFKHMSNLAKYLPITSVINQWHPNKVKKESTEELRRVNNKTEENAEVESMIIK